MAMNVSQHFRFSRVQAVSVGLGTLRQIADHVERPMQTMQLHTMSKLPLPSGEGVQPWKGEEIMVPLACILLDSFR